MIKKLLIATLIILISLFGLYVYSILYPDYALNQPIGGQRDEHGCLGPAGYTWNQTVGACVRNWELNENQKEAARIAVEYVSFDYATTIVGVDLARCPGCFVVHIEKGTDRVPADITLIGWEVIS